ncbi:MAG: PD40 domain-containing protein [Acidimicrobiia bacterium]|nr:MAG: PD40 domain-containing protein [Acidimicrobiia bacterium]
MRTLIVAVAVVAAACSPSSDGENDGLLAIVDDLGQVVIVTADGDVVAEATDFAEGTTAFQPVWSGPGQIVYVEQTAGGGSLVVAGVGAAETRRTEFPTPPFYIYPRPGGGGTADIVTLRNRAGGGLAAEIVAGDASIAELDGDFPFFFGWTADGRVVAHSENAYLDEVHPDRLSIATDPGSFAAPGVRDNQIVYVRSTGPASFLAVISGEKTVDLATVRGPAHLVVGSDRVAVRSIAVPGTGGVEVLAQSVPSVPPDALVVVGLDDGSLEIVADDSIVAFFWDPSGRRLLYLEVGDEGSGELSWHVWEEGEVTDFPSFAPEPTWFATFVPFFDQYAQSMTLWSPDGSAFAFPGMVGGEPGVWVQQLDRETPVRIAAGSWVAWGPAA